MKTVPDPSQPDLLAALPSADDPGLRFAAPANRPCVAGTNAFRVLEAGGLTPRLDRDAALLFLRHDEYDSRRSFFQDLRIVPARAPIRRLCDGGLELGRGDGPHPIDLPFEDACRAARDLVRRAVDEAIRPFGRVGIWLSGGTDSSVVAAAAAETWRKERRDPRDLVAYHLLRRGMPSELRPATRVADALGLELRVLELEAADPFEGSEALYPHLDAPPDAGGAGAALGALARMGNDGMEAFVTGDGGDEVFGADLPLLPTIVSRLPASLRRTLRRGRSARHKLGWLETRLSREAVLEPRPLPRRGLIGVAALRDRRTRCARQAVLVSWLRAVAGVAGLEVRVPLLDPRVTDFAVQVAPSHHRHAREERPLLRLAFADPLADAWAGRTKRDQPLIEQRRIDALREHRDRWLALLAGGVLERSDLVPREAATRILADAGHGDVRLLYRALALVSLELWCRARGLEGSA